MSKYYSAVKFEKFIICTSEVTDEELRIFESDHNKNNLPGKNSNLNIRYDQEKYYLFEWKEYTVVGTELHPLDQNDFFYFGKIGRHNTGSILFKNFIGTSIFREQIFYVESEKMSSEDVDELISKVDERVKQTISINFSSHAINHAIFKKSKVRYQDYYVYQKLYNTLLQDKIFPYIQQIQRGPNKHFKTDKKMTSISTIQNISENTLIDMITDQSNMTKVSNGSFSKSLSKYVSKSKGFISEEVNEYYNDVSFDTNENRFIKFFIELCIRILTSFINELNEKKENQTANFLLINSLQKYRENFQKILKMSFFKEISSVNSINYGSSILTRQYGYKQIYQEYINLKQAPINLFDTENLISLYENKSIDKLYEYICLFRIVDILESIYGKKSTEIINFSKGIKLYTVGLSEENGGVEFIFQAIDDLPESIVMFQHSFTKTNNGSYSLEFKPDITVQIKKNEKIYNYHFDSKFRTSKNNYSNNEDLVKMHSYRDGILNTVGSYVLYPGTKKEFYTMSGSQPFSGIGAFPMNINSTNDEDIYSMLKQCLKNIY